tara:strand:+ start:373 stop:1467 length:1095 start_codon:yes stop_codon:yes gene_type:complete
MLEIYLPIVQVNIDIFLLLFLSLIVGVLSGLFGVGGGFLMTPFLIFMGIPPVYAVPNEVNNILATSVSGSLTHWFKNTLDYKMGIMIVAGGTVGTLLGISSFTYFDGIGKISIIISLLYMYLLAIVGTLMLVEALRTASQKKLVKKKLHEHNWLQGLPLRMRFQKSRLYESALTPILLGLVVGFVAAMMGIGGAFLMVPAMIYIVGMPVKLIPGTSLFVTIFISAIVTVLHSFNYGSIDFFLVVPLILGSIVGVQLGQKLGQYLDSNQLKSLFALLLCSVAVAIGYDTFFRDQSKLINEQQVVNTDLNRYAEFSLKLSNEFPFLYGSFAIILAITLGILAAWLRKLVSDFRRKKPKEEVKFPEK